MPDDFVEVQKAFTGMCRDYGFSPDVVSASVLVQEIERGRDAGESHMESFAQDFLAVCKHHGVSPMDAAKAIHAKFSQESREDGR